MQRVPRKPLRVVPLGVQGGTETHSTQNNLTPPVWIKTSLVSCLIWFLWQPNIATSLVNFQTTPIALQEQKPIGFLLWRAQLLAFCAIGLSFPTWHWMCFAAGGSWVMGTAYCCKVLEKGMRLWGWNCLGVGSQHRLAQPSLPALCAWPEPFGQKFTGCRCKECVNQMYLRRWGIMLNHDTQTLSFTL